MGDFFVYILANTILLAIVCLGLFTLSRELGRERAKEERVVSTRQDYPNDEFQISLLRAKAYTKSFDGPAVKKIERSAYLYNQNPKRRKLPRRSPEIARDYRNG